MEINKIIRKVETQGPYRVINLYDFDSNSYLASCENRMTKNRIGDFIYLINKRTGEVSGYNPASDPFTFGAKMKKAKVIYSA